MAFSEKLKEEVKKKALFRCVICQQPFVEIHHIQPQSEGGDDTMDNAAPLCGRCHDLYGGNPEKRKQIRQMRDNWYEMVEKMIDSGPEKFTPIISDPNRENALRNKKVAIYHVVLENEDFVLAAKMLYKLVYMAQQQNPNQPRVLYLDIDGHRNKQGGFDHDMFELQKDFVLGFLSPYLSEVHMPLLTAVNDKLQQNEMAEELAIFGYEDY